MRTASRATNKRAKYIFEQHIRRFRGHLIIETGQRGNRAEIYRWNGIRIHVSGIERESTTPLPKGWIEKEAARCDISAVVNVNTEEVTYIRPMDFNRCLWYPDGCRDGSNKASWEAIYAIGKQHPLAALREE